MNGQMSLFDFIEDPDREKKEKAKAWSGISDSDPWREKKPSDRKLDKAVKDAKKAISGLRETSAKRTGEEMAAGFAEGVLGGIEALKPAPAGIERETAETRRKRAQAKREGTKKSIGDEYMAAGFTNAYDKMPEHPCDIEVIDHEGHRFRTKAVESFGRIAFDATKGRGYDICWWKEIPAKICGEDDPPCAWKDGSHCQMCDRKPKQITKPQEIRQPCGRPCDVECFSKTCFIRRGQIWHPEGRHNWLRDENGKIIIGPKQCDWMPVNHSGVNATFECFAEYPTESGGIHFGECEKGIEPGQKRNCEGCEVHRKFYEIAREYQEQGKTWGEAVALTCYLVGVHTIAEYTPDAYMYGIKYDESADEWIPKNWRKGGENGRTKKI